jgi:hypothetical protein
LNQETRNEGVPVFIDLGGAKSVADGVGAPISTMRLADMNGNGFDDYVYVDEVGALWVWWNDAGNGTTNMQTDHLHFADIDGDGLDDYVYINPQTGAPTVYTNEGVFSGDSLGWRWNPLNNGNPIASGTNQPQKYVKFGDINGDGRDDYLLLDHVTGQLEVFLNGGPANNADGWIWHPKGVTASGLGNAKDIRFADIDGDGVSFDVLCIEHSSANTQPARRLHLLVP